MLEGFSKEANTFLIILSMWVTVAIGKTLIAEGPVDGKRLCGEVLLAGVGSFIMYSFGMYQNMDTWQMLFLGSLAGLGGVRGMTWTVKIVKQLSSLKT